MPKRNDKVRRAERQQRAKDREIATSQFSAYFALLSPEERLIVSIFGAHEECMECGNFKLVSADCVTPHCKALRNEESEFYDHVDEDSITIRGATMYAGIDY